MIRVLRSIPVAQLKLLVFDLDGTLIDSAQDLCNSVNAALTEFGLGPLPDPTIAGFVGNGAPLLIRRALALASKIPIEQVGEDLFKNAYAFFLQYYREHKLDFTYAYEGVLDALKALDQLHQAPGNPARAMAVLTNKPVRMTRSIVDGLGIRGHFFQVYGGNSFEQKKPHPMGVEALMREAGVERAATMMVGDSSVDVLTARNAGIFCCGVTYGFQPETLADPAPDLLVDRMEQVADWLLQP